MDISILKKLLPGLLPLFVFILADEIWGTKVGLVVALVFGVAELVIVWIRERKIDKFIIIDTALLVALGGVSIILDNDIFFKFKPGLIQLIFLPVVGLSAFSKHNLLLTMTSRYMKDVKLNEFHINKMRRTMKIMFWIIALHTLLVFYSALYMSKEAWGFVSGGLFYIIFGVYFVYEFIKNKILMNQYQAEEWFPLVDADGNITGKAPRRVCHGDNSLLHPVVHLHVFNDAGELFLQKRPHTKDVQPDKWDTAVGGHVGLNEAIEVALHRESDEEINIRDFEPFFVKKYVWKTDIESELVHVFITKYNRPIRINKNELADGRFWSLAEIEQNLNDKTFTPNFINEIELLKSMNLFGKGE